LDPIRQNPVFLVLQEIVRAQPGYLSILRQRGDYAKDSGTNPVNFTYESKQNPV